MQEADVELVVKATAGIVGWSTGFVVKQIIANNLDDPENFKQRVQIYVGSGALAAMAAKQANTYASKRFKSLLKTYHELQAKLEEAKGQNGTVPAEPQDS